MAKQNERKAYHRFFEDYAEIQTSNAKGKTVVQRIYVGHYYRVDLPDDAHQKRKIALLLLFIAALALCLYGGLTAPASGARLTALMTMLSLLMLVLLGAAIFYRLTAPREMEKRVYRDSSDRLKALGVLSTLGLFATALGVLVTALANERYRFSDNAPGILTFALGGGCALWLTLLERRTRYIELPPKHQRPEGGAPTQQETPNE
ncbi:MAG: hypothetical protein IJ662_07380 [Clostridia bacterium]|nr:hypothetical protein [Clostridia bacterium]